MKRPNPVTDGYEFRAKTVRVGRANFVRITEYKYVHHHDVFDTAGVIHVRCDHLDHLINLLMDLKAEAETSVTFDSAKVDK